MSEMHINSGGSRERRLTAELASKDAEIARLREDNEALRLRTEICYSGADMANAAEAIRAKCEAVCDENNAERTAFGEYQHGYWDACNEIKTRISALKGKGEWD